MKITIVSSSTREGRVSPRIAYALNHRLEEKGHTPNIIDVADVKLPPFIERHQFISEEKKPDGWDQVMKTLTASDGIIFVTPEYNGGISSGLKNFIDVFAKKGFSGKPIGVATGSAGAMGGIRAAYQLQQTILCIYGYPQPQMLTVSRMEDEIGADGNHMDEDFLKKLDKFLDSFTEFVSKFC